MGQRAELDQVPAWDNEQATTGQADAMVAGLAPGDQFDGSDGALMRGDRVFLPGVDEANQVAGFGVG